MACLRIYSARLRNRGALLLGTLLGACAAQEGDPAALGSTTQSVQLDRLGSYYDVAFAPAPSLRELKLRFPEASDGALLERLRWELAVQAMPYWASGAITIPAGVSALEGATREVRFSCGATLISPSWVVTAGHCVDRGKLGQLTLHLYRPTPRLAQSYGKASQLTGSWPAFENPELSADDGYLSDEYACEIRHRCWSGTQEPLACPDGSDSALLYCPGRPGDKYGFVNVNKDALLGREALMHWKHELLSPAQLNKVSEFETHYRVYPSSFEQNYHYYDLQLLPLRSVHYGLAQAPTFLMENGVDAHGCHGTSGSGILARVGSSLDYQLAGPAATGHTLDGFLCAESSTSSVDSWRGVRGLGINWPNPNALLSLEAKALEADCLAREIPAGDTADLPFAVGARRVSTVFSYLACQSADFGQQGVEQPDSLLGPYPEKYIELSASAERTFTGFTASAQEQLRVALFSAQSSECGQGCGELILRSGEQLIASAGPPGTGLVGGTLTAEQPGPLPIAARSTGQRRAVGGLVVIQEGRVNSFDTPEDRLEAALYALESLNPKQPLPMRFVGDGSVGFAAQLAPGERMALLREALIAGQRWTVRMEASQYEHLTCGLLDMRGDVVRKGACAAWFTLDDRAGVEGRLGFFVELSSASNRKVEIRYAALASGAARDRDDDEVPDVLDNCPHDRNPAQQRCDEQPALGDAGARDGASDASSANLTIDGDASGHADASFIESEQGEQASADEESLHSAQDSVVSTPAGAKRDTRGSCTVAQDRAGALPGALGLALGLLMVARRRRTGASKR